MPTKFEDWLKDQGEEAQKLFDEHVKGLKSALESERDERKKAIEQLGELQKSAEKGSAFEKQVSEMRTSLENKDLQVKFYESAIGAGVKNPKAAFVLAQADGLVSKDSIKFDDLKKSYPELFNAEVTPKGNAGDGTDNPPPDGKPSMDNWIRRIN